MKRYSIFSTEGNPKYCAIYDLPDDLKDPAGPAEGERVGSDHVDGQEFRMAKEVKGIQVPDVIDNALGYLMVGERMRDLLKAHATAEIEFLRFKLLNHKGRVASDRCYIINVLGTVDCVDLDRTEGTPHAILEGQLGRITRLFLDEKRIPKELNLFRISSRPRVLIIRDDLKKAVEKEGITGVGYLELGEAVEL